MLRTCGVSFPLQILTGLPLRTHAVHQPGRLSCPYVRLHRSCLPQLTHPPHPTPPLIDPLTHPTLYSLTHAPAVIQAHPPTLTADEKGISGSTAAFIALHQTLLDRGAFALCTCATGRCRAEAVCSGLAARMVG